MKRLNVEFKSSFVSLFLFVLLMSFHKSIPHVKTFALICLFSTISLVFFGIVKDWDSPEKSEENEEKRPAILFLYIAYLASFVFIAIKFHPGIYLQIILGVIALVVLILICSPFLKITKDDAKSIRRKNESELQKAIYALPYLLSYLGQDYKVVRDSLLSSERWLLSKNLLRISKENKKEVLRVSSFGQESIERLKKEFRMTKIRPDFSAKDEYTFEENHLAAAKFLVKLIKEKRDAKKA